MKTFLSCLLCCLFLFHCIAGAAEVENPVSCRQCGMNRAMFAQSRMLMGFADGSVVGVCSVTCAAEVIRSSKLQVTSLKVSDYRTRELIDAGSATWVMGGSQPGVMSSVPKWAFAARADAQTFVRESGGRLANFEQVLQAVNLELAQGGTGHDHSAHAGHDMSGHMGPGSQMLFNPAFGDDVYHTHPAGMWMVNYKFMHMNMNGLQDGTKNVSPSQVTPVGSKPYGFMMAPTGMTMDMQMLMLMYGVTDRLTLMAMATYQSNKMEMVMNMGMGNVATAPMRTSGFGDTELRGIFGISKSLNASLGLSIPTGDIKQTVEMMGTQFRAPYDMQLGSGTVDLKPSLTYNAVSDDALWNWGGQATYTYRPTDNDEGYRLGNSLKLTSWIQRALGPASAWLRLAFTDTQRIHGQDPEIAKLLDPATGAPTPDADPANYGGQRLDGYLGISWVRGPFSIGAEGGIPLFQDVNGLQLVNDWYVNAGLQVMF